VLPVNMSGFPVPGSSGRFFHIESPKEFLYSRQQRRPYCAGGERLKLSDFSRIDEWNPAGCGPFANDGKAMVLAESNSLHLCKSGWSR